ncbi:MAG TPA: hypothetical protein VFQ53_40655 [Kofleriaceae bacterium]|nr:hypothetical protein [Kofleriaceae bacterium]
MVTVSVRGEARAGARAAAAWLSARGLAVAAPKRWDVAIVLESISGERLALAIDAKEWSFRFHQGTLQSWIRVVDLPVVNERDDFALVANVPPLRGLGALVQRLEDDHQFTFRRQQAKVRTNIAGAEAKIRLWVVAAL